MLTLDMVLQTRLTLLGWTWQHEYPLLVSGLPIRAGLAAAADLDLKQLPRLFLFACQRAASTYVVAPQNCYHQCATSGVQLQLHPYFPPAPAADVC